MSDPAIAVIDVEKIDIEEGLNPRKRFDEDRLADLEADVRQNGIVQALTVKPTDGGRFTLIAGERRFRAAKSVGTRSQGFRSMERWLFHVSKYETIRPC